MFGTLASIREYLRAWRAESARACRTQYGIWIALPVIAGCIEAFVFPRATALGFLALALFLAPRWDRRLVAQALLFVAWSTWLAFDAVKPRVTATEDVLTGQVAGFPSGSGRITFLLKTADETFRVEAQESTFPIRPGQGIRILGRRADPEAPTNPGQFDFPRYLRSQEIQGVFRATSISLRVGPGLWDRAVAGARDALGEALACTVPPSQLPLFEAALLGDVSALDPAIMEDFRASGMLHVLAISGQHIGIICLILLRLFSLLRLPRKAAFLLTGAIVAFYVPVSGGSISVLRSALMYGCLLPAILWERPTGGLNNLALAAVLILLWMPGQILSLGFQLSFGATFFLILYSRPISKGLARLSLPRALRGAAGYAWPTTALSGIIFLGLLPVLSATVHLISPTSVAGNLGTVGLSSGMLIAGCMALLASPIPILGALLGEAAGCFSAWLAAVIHLLARLPGSSLPVEGLPPLWGLFLLLLLLAFPFALRRRRGRLLVLVGAVAFSGRWAFLEARDLCMRPATVAFLDVGQGDAAVLRLPGADILLDAGPVGAGKNVILPYLRSAGIRRLDLTIVTHPDLDHYGGLAEVAHGMPIDRVFGNGDSSDARAWKLLGEDLGHRAVPRIAARAGQILYRHGDIVLEALSPDGNARFRNRNDASVVLLLRLGKERILLTGDMEKESQAWLLVHGPADLRGAILKVPHHGSDRTTDLAFLSALAPETAIISAGRRNRFGHPGPGNLETLRRAGSRLFLTPRHGAVLYHRNRSGSRWETFLPVHEGAGAGGD